MATRGPESTTFGNPKKSYITFTQFYLFPKETHVPTSVKFGILEDEETAEAVVNNRLST